MNIPDFKFFEALINNKIMKKFRVRGESTIDLYFSESMTKGKRKNTFLSLSTSYLLKIFFYDERK